MNRNRNSGHLRRRPRHVRNWWCEASVDGRKTPIAFGPATTDGGMHLVLYQRSRGAPVLALYIDCRVDPTTDALVCEVSVRRPGQESVTKIVSHR